MNLLIISDVHGRADLIRHVREVSDADLIVFAGDIAPYGVVHKSFDVLAKFVEYVGSKVVVAVPGNMDPLGIYERAEQELGVKVVHGKAFTINDVAFIGAGGSPPTPFRTLTEFSEGVIGELLKRAYSQVRSKDRIVLVTHAPPYGTKCDVVVTGQHVGSVKVMEFIEEHQPVLCVCGHIHESRAVDEVGVTKVVNPGPLYRRWYAVAKIVEDEVLVELKKF